MKDYFVNVVSSLMIAASGWAFNRYALGDPGAGAAELWSNLTVVVLIGSLMVMFRLNRLRGACVAAHSVDYKFYADPARDGSDAHGELYHILVVSFTGLEFLSSCACDELERGHAVWIFGAEEESYE